MKKKYIVAVGILTFVLLLPVLLTQPAFFNIFVFANTGQIGDTIGGIMGPAINIIGAILIYLSFEKQREANQIQQDKNNYDILTTHYNEVYNGLTSLEIETFDPSDKNKVILDSLKGFPALETLKNGIEKVGDSFVNYHYRDTYNHLLNCMFNMELFLIELSNSRIDDRNRLNLYRKFHYMYTTHLSTTLPLMLKAMDKTSKYEELKIMLVSVIDRNNKMYDSIILPTIAKTKSELK